MRAQFMVSTDFIRTQSSTASDAALGAWVRLCSTSAIPLLGGRFEGAKAMRDLDWMRLAQVTRKAVQAVVAAGLAKWDGDDLVLIGYDLHGETIWRRKSDGGAKGAARKWSESHKDSHMGVPSRSADRSPIKESHQDSDKAIAIAIAKAIAKAREGVAPPCAGDPTATPISSTDPEDSPMTGPLRARGAKIDHDDPAKQAELRAEWTEACKHLTSAQIIEVFETAMQPIRFAREFVAARKAWVAATGWRMPAVTLPREAAELAAEAAERERKREQAERDRRTLEYNATPEGRARAAAILGEARAYQAPVPAQGWVPPREVVALPVSEPLGDDLDAPPADDRP